MLIFSFIGFPSCCVSTGFQEDLATPTRGRSRKEKPEVPREAPKEKKAAPRSRKGIHPSPGTMTTLSELDQGSPTAEASSEKLLRLGS